MGLRFFRFTVWIVFVFVDLANAAWPGDVCIAGRRDGCLF